MQIHELNNFSGTLGSGAYLAIDDGNDTGKISSQGLLAATEARIDNIIAGDAPSAAEVVDARLGADGVTYSSLGTGIRSQFTDVKSALDIILITHSELTNDNQYIEPDGDTVTGSNFHVSNLIPIDASKKIRILTSGTIPGGCAVAFYGSNEYSSKGFLSGIALEEAVVAGTPKDVDVPASAKYVAFSARKANAFSAMISQAIAVSSDKLEALNTDVNGLVLDKATWTAGVKTTAGVKSVSANSGFYSVLIDKRLFSSISIGAKQGYQFSYCKYDSDGVFVSRSSWITVSAELDNSYSYIINIATTAEYTSKTLDEMLSKFDIVIHTDALAAKVDNVINGVVLDWTDAVIASNGVISGSSNSAYYSSLISKESFSTIKITPVNGFQLSVCTYDENGFIARSAWSEESVTINNNYACRINIATVETVGSYIPLDEMLQNFTFEIADGSLKHSIENTSGEERTAQANMHLWTCDVGRPVIHFSFDDVCESLRAIINGSYSSVFNQQFFSDLKDIHDTYGAVFTLNCFNTSTTYNDYSIADLPSSYQSELQGAKDWLKFAFHAENESSNYNTSTGIVASYQTFVSAIYNFTGDYDCIDRITRLGYFGGNLANVLAIKDESHGIIGLLTADDNRISYYFDSDTNNILINKGKHYDVDNDLLFIRSQPRVDSNSGEAIENIIKANPCFYKLTEIFCHEQGWGDTFKSRIENICAWANQNGYVHEFPSLIYG